MIFRQLIHDDLGCASYLVGDGDAGAVAVIDPRFEIDEYLELSRYLGVRIEHVLETHTHADHVSGHGRLAEATGRRSTCTGRRASSTRTSPSTTAGSCPSGGFACARSTRRATGPSTPRSPSWTRLGAPRRGPSSPATRCSGRRRAPRPRRGARGGRPALYRSLTDGPLSLPPETEVWPGHLGGSMCGGPDMDQKISSTIGFELGHNPILSEASEDGFVERALAGLGPQPPRFGDIVALNRGPLLTAGVRAAPVGPRGRPDGRPGGAAGRRAPTSSSPRPTSPARCWSPTCAPASAPSWRGSPSPARRSSSSADDADGLRGPPGGVGRGAQRRRPSRRRNDELARGAPPRGADGAAAGRGPALRLAADPRSRSWTFASRASGTRGGSRGSVHAPYHDIRGIPDGIDPARPVAVVCASGQRSSVGASLLMRAGRPRSSTSWTAARAPAPASGSRSRPADLILRSSLRKPSPRAARTASATSAAAQVQCRTQVAAVTSR